MNKPPRSTSRRQFLELCADALGATPVPAHAVAAAGAAERPAAVTPHAVPGSMPLIRRGQPAAVLADPDGLPGVRRVERIVRARGINTDAIARRWEACLLQVVEHPEPGVPHALPIAGADRRGTIYGLDEISRRIGVSPWVRWADVPVARRDDLHAAPGRWIDAPTVRWGGIFPNDENPCLGE